MKKRAEKSLEGNRRLGGESRANDAFKISLSDGTNS